MLLFAMKACWLFQVKERPDVGVYVKDLSSYVMNNADDLDKTMTLGNKNSMYSENNMAIVYVCFYAQCIQVSTIHFFNSTFVSFSLSVFFSFVV